MGGCLAIVILGPSRNHMPRNSAVINILGRVTKLNFNNVVHGLVPGEKL
jgi:hypothetical protein